jgi:proline-rich nuclear receptor coactivator 2
LIRVTTMDPRNPPKSANRCGKAQSKPTDNSNNNSQSFQSFQPFDNIKINTQKHYNTPSPKPKSPSNQKRYSPKPFLQRQNSSPKPIPSKKEQSTPSRYSPIRTERSLTPPSQSSPTNFASSMIYQPPTPSSLPKPPVHWTTCSSSNVNSQTNDPTTQLRLLLNVQA